MYEQEIKETKEQIRQKIGEQITEKELEKMAESVLLIQKINKNKRVFKDVYDNDLEFFDIKTILFYIFLGFLLYKLIFHNE